MKTMKLHIQKLPSMKNSEIHTYTHQRQTVKNQMQRVLKEVKRLTIHKGSSVKLTASFPSEIMETRGNGKAH